MNDLRHGAEGLSLVERLCALDAELTQREQRLLRNLLIKALDPLDRRRFFGNGFTDGELAILERLETQRSGRKASEKGAL